MKRCSRCRRWLELSAFSRSADRRDGLQNKCRECCRAYAREHYEANVRYYVEKAKRWKKGAAQESLASRRRSLREAKAVPCADCGNAYPYWVMDFDHVRGDKSFNIAGGVLTGRARLESEVAKCDVVCANCHRRRTWQRSHSGS